MKYEYQATDQVGEIINGELTAPNKDYVLNWLAKKQLTPVSIKEIGVVKEVKKLKLPSHGRLSPLDKIILVKRLGAVLRAGIPVVEGLEILIRDSEKPYLEKVLNDVKTVLERGETLASGFASYPRDFSPVFVGLVQAGENAGNLDKTLKEIVVQLTKEYELKRSVRAAMIYPTILLIVSIIIITVMITFVLPRITVAFEQSGVELPLVTRIVIKTSDIFSQNPVFTILGLFVFLGLGMFLALWSPIVIKRVMEKVYIRIPILSKLIKQMALARFAGILSGLLKGGLPAVEALTITAESIGNETYRGKIAQTVEAIKRGTSIADSLRGNPSLFPHMLISMIAVGEKSGTLDETLGSLAEFYEDEVDRLLKNILALVEPLMLLIMGLVIGLIAVSILLPIYKMVSGIQ